MASFFFPVSLMLAAVIFLHLVELGICQPYHLNHRNFHALAGQAATSVSSSTVTPHDIGIASATPCSTGSCATATPALSTDCEAANGTAYTEVPEMDKYTIICNIDFPAQNIYPFILAGSFEECLLQCETVNKQSEATRCAGFVFAPERVHDADDCYLKSALNSPGPATISLVGATLVNTATDPAATTTSSNAPSSATTSYEVASSTDTPSSGAEGLPVPVYLKPKISKSQLLGASTDNPTDQYIDHPMAQPQKLQSSLLVPGINLDLVTKYEIAGDTGSWTENSSPLALTLAQLSVTPHMSRDGGKGGSINGTQLFVFCDTASFANGAMVGFVSSSVAVDIDLNGRDGKALTLIDQIGEWQDDVGRMRGFGPMTTGEEAFNIRLSGDGYRYAIWPESSLIPLNQTHSLMYASLVYDEVDMSTQAANFTEIGNTLLVVSVDLTYGPGAERVVNLLFDETEVAWGSLGGIRSWGNSGIGGMDGMVYLFGSVDGGVLVARTNPAGVSDRSTYSYWDGSSWSLGMLPTTATSYLLDTSVMDFDLMYSPYHGTFIMIYTTPNADNTFYYRYLEPGSAIEPPYSGGSGDYVENIVYNDWSSEQVLYQAPAPPISFIYAGAFHAGYFGDDDITNGGKKMLLSWTQHTGQEAISPESGYSHMTVVITLE